MLGQASGAVSGSGGIGALREEEREGEKRKRERESGREIEGGRGEENLKDIKWEWEIGE